MSILSKILQKRGIKDITELSDEERVDFENWQKVLNKEEIQVKDILEFCEGAMTSIESQFGDVEIPDDRMAKLTLQHAVYKRLKQVIEAPETEKENLSNYLTGLLK